MDSEGHAIALGTAVLTDDTGHPLSYMIRFENQTDATAPAQRVVITQQFDADLDFRTFRVDDFGWGDVRVEPTGNQSFYQGRVDFDDSRGFDVDITVTLDVLTGKAIWILQSVDPSTGEAPTDALSGFLPPNDANGIGEGFVSYAIRPKRTALTGAVVDAEARIVFDDNEPIDTPAIFNTLDAAAPNSAVEELPATFDVNEFLVRWSGQDDAGGSTLASFTVYVSERWWTICGLVERDDAYRSRLYRPSWASLRLLLERTRQCR
jgi:hypothetical protein